MELRDHSLRRTVLLDRTRRALALLSLVAIAACSKTGGTTAPANGRVHAKTQPHVLRFADISDVTTLNPIASSALVLSHLSELTMAYLVKFDADNHRVPEIATEVPTIANGGIAKDGLTYTYHLRSGLKWSDGQPLSASDVLFTVKKILDPKTNIISRDGWDRIASTTAPDPTTVVFKLKRPYSPFISTVFATGEAGPSILPEHLLAHADINTDAYNQKPVGAGPFRYVAWKRADRVVMERNPYYFRGKPKLERVEYLIVPSRDTLVNELGTNDVDLWPIAPRKYYQRLTAVAGYHVLRHASPGVGQIDFNLTHPVVAELAVRRALLLATDRVGLLKKLYNGIGVVQDGIEGASTPYYDPSIPITPYDPFKANATLDAAGWKRGADGVRVKDGLRLSIDYATNAGSPDTDLYIEQLRAMWKKVGAELVQREYAPALLFALGDQGGILFGGKFDALGFANYYDPSPDLSSSYSCRQYPPNGQNASHFCDPVAQRAIDDGLETSDTAKQIADNKIVQERIAALVPIVNQAIYEDLYAMSDDLKGFRPGTYAPFDQMMDVDI